jgi:hypothetical protein
MIHGVYLAIALLVCGLDQTSAQVITECSDSCYKSYQANENTCFCYSKCSEFQDCCHDRHINNAKPRNDTELDANTPVVKCDIELSKNKFLFSISSCAKWWHTGTYKRNRCELSALSPGELTFLHYVPVFYKPSGQIYANYYCAQCNIKQINLKGLAFFNISGYSADKNTEVPSDLSYIFSSVDYLINKRPGSNVQARFLTPENFLINRTCEPSLAECPGNVTLSLKQNCNNLADLNYASKVVTISEYCAICKGFDEKVQSCDKSVKPKPLREQENLQIRFEQSKSKTKTEILVKLVSVENSKAQEVSNKLFQSFLFTHCLPREDKFLHLPLICNRYTIAQSTKKKSFFFRSREKDMHGEAAADEDDDGHETEAVITAALQKFCSTLGGKIFSVCLVLILTSLWFWFVSNFCTIVFRNN